jgi:hypothetical protein
MRAEQEQEQQGGHAEHEQRREWQAARAEEE